MQYGANEESVGYDLRVARVAKRGQGKRTKAIESKTKCYAGKKDSMG